MAFLMSVTPGRRASAHPFCVDRLRCWPSAGHLSQRWLCHPSSLPSLKLVVQHLGTATQTMTQTYTPNFSMHALPLHGSLSVRQVCPLPSRPPPWTSLREFPVQSFALLHWPVETGTAHVGLFPAIRTSAVSLGPSVAYQLAWFVLSVQRQLQRHHLVL